VHTEVVKVLIVHLSILILGTGMALLREVVVPKLAAHWNVVADALGYKKEDKELIRKKFCNDPLECCAELLEDWLSNDKGVTPKSWSKLIEVLRKSKSLAVATEEIVKELAVAKVLV